MRLSKEEIENVAKNLKVAGDDPIIDDSEVLFYRGPRGWTVAHELARLGCRFSDRSTVLKLEDINKYTVAHTMASMGHVFPLGHPALSYVNNEGMSVEDLTYRYDPNMTDEQRTVEAKRKLSNMSAIYKKMFEDESHHNHPIDYVNGVYRWRRSTIVHTLVTETLNLDNIVRLLLALGYDKNSEVYRKLHRDMGVSIYNYSFYL